MLSKFHIAQKWASSHPDRIQRIKRNSLPRPNGVKVPILLEETGLPYGAHRISLDQGGVLSPHFLSLNPNNNIPAITNPNGPDGKALALFESGAMLLYPFEKSGEFLPRNPATRYETIQWLMFQMAGVGTMFRQLAFFHRFAGKDYEDKRPLARHVNETRRLLGVRERRLCGRMWIMGKQYTIADIAIFPWGRILSGYHEATELIGTDTFPNVQRALVKFVTCPAVGWGLIVP